MVIYKITNTINKKVYVGQTIRPLKKRWWEHKKKSQQSDLPLYRAMRKYGKENFTIEEIDGANSQTELNYLETHYIYNLNSLTSKNGYNSTVMTSSGLKHSQETRDKISCAILEMDKAGSRNIRRGVESHSYGNSYRKGTKHSQETRDKISKAGLGRFVSKETKAKMSEVHSKRMEDSELRSRISKTLIKNSPLKKSIVRSDGVVFESIHECARQMKTYPSAICRVLSKERKTHRKYSFEYLEIVNE